MIDRLRPYAVTGLLAGLSLAMAGAIALMLEGGTGLRANPSNPVEPAEAVEADAQPASLTLAPIDSYRGFVDRPLFFPFREKFIPADPEPEVEASADAAVATPASLVSDASTMVLEGIVLNDTDRVALVRLVDSGTYQRVRAGDEIAGWRIREIQPYSVLLESPDGSQELRLDYRDTESAIGESADIPPNWN